MEEGMRIVPACFNPNYTLGIDAELQDRDAERLEGFEGHTMGVWTRILKAFMRMRLRLCAMS
jgi:hypothetical protein